MPEQSDLVDEFYRLHVRPLGNLVILFAQAEASLLELVTVLVGDEFAAHELLKKPDAKYQLLERIQRCGLAGFQLTELVQGVEGLWSDKEQRNRYFHDEWFPNVLDSGKPIIRGLRRKDAKELFGEPTPEEIWTLALCFRRHANLVSATAYNLRPDES